MKKTLLSATVAIAILAITGNAFAAKPADNQAGAQKYAWHLSGDVMPSPPWGLADIIGSDTESKLIVNKPNGKVNATITGVMNGLNPNTIYTVYPSKMWSSTEKWNAEGDWKLTFVYSGRNYNHTMNISSQNMQTGVFTGSGVSMEGIPWTIQAGSKITGDTITLILKYNGSSYTVTANGTINENGEIVSGSWSSSTGQAGSWGSTEGNAVKEDVGNGYPGLLSGQSTFTFTTDEFGSGSWHLNLKDSPISGFSIWINGAGRTVLISDNVSL